MQRAAFLHVDTWVFDLDNTLYPPSARLFDQLEARMTAWVMRTVGVDATEADRLRRQYWAEYGTTLGGLMTEHAVKPEDYLIDVHDICLDALDPDPDLAKAIGGLPGRKIVYTNGSADYAARVVAARGLDGLFDAVFGVEHAGYRPKPQKAAFEAVFGQAGIDGTRGAMFEDDVRNLSVPHEMGMRTVHVAPQPDPHDHIHHHTSDLAVFLSQLGDR